MKILPSLLLAAAILSTCACASKSTNLRQARDMPVAQDVVATEVADRPDSFSLSTPVEFTSRDAGETQAIDHSNEHANDDVSVDAPTLALIADDAAASNDPVIGSGELSAAEQDAVALYSDVVVRDPWEAYNRRIHRFNNVVDRYVLHPLAVGYAKVVPAPVQSGVSRFFGNLGVPATAINQALQGHPVHALQSLARFAVNATIGIGGVLDPATHMGIPDRDDEDFGQTLAAWGWRDSRYLVMPFLGPRTVRDSVAIVGDQRLSPIAYVDDSRTAISLQILEIVDVRTRLLSLDDARRDAHDEYALVRDAWAQRRRYRIEQD